jgi:hypothetical protein
MSRVPPPWIIDEVERARRQRGERQQPRLEIPRPPGPPPPDESAPRPRMTVVLDWSSDEPEADR